MAARGHIRHELAEEQTLQTNMGDNEDNESLC